MKKVFLIPTAITAFGLTCGLFVIFKVSLYDTDQDLFRLLQASTILLVIAAIADIADGAVARLIKAESEFGVQFDSLSDAVNFGVAPPLLVLKSLAEDDLGRLVTFFIVITSMIYTLCGVLRLVRFNLSKKEAAAQDKKHFTGLPIPAAASTIVSTALILISPMVKDWFPSIHLYRPWILMGVLIILGYFMVSRWKFPSLKALHFRVPSFYLVFATGVFAVLILYGILDFFAIAFFAASWLYVLISWSLSLTRLIAGKRLQKLADFDPEQEEEGD